MKETSSRGWEATSGVPPLPLAPQPGGDITGQYEITAPGGGSAPDESAYPSQVPIPTGREVLATYREVVEAPEVAEAPAERAPEHGSMVFKNVVENPWTPENLSENLRVLGAENTQVTDTEADSWRECYDAAPTMRSYHGHQHGANMGQPDVPAELAAKLSPHTSAEKMAARFSIAGMHHDAAYKHVDALDDQGTRAWPTVLKTHIDGTAVYDVTMENGVPMYHTFLTEKGEQDPTVQMVARMFSVGDDGIGHKQGGNEFDSALASANFLAKKGVPLEEIIANTAMIAGTVPFRPAYYVGEDGQILSDGHMGDLAQKVHDELLASGVATEADVWARTNDIMLGVVHLANRDISPFIKPGNFAEVVHGGRGVKAEEVPELREVVTNTEELARAGGIQKSAPVLYGSLGKQGGGFVPAENVPHSYIMRDPEGNLGDPETGAYPPKSVYDGMVNNARENASMAAMYFTAHEAGIVTVASMATFIQEPKAPVPGFVHAVNWHPKAIAPTAASLSPADRAIYEELRYGHGQQQIDSATPRQSPVASIIFGALGSEGTQALSDHIKSIREQAKAHGNGNDNPFSDETTARNFLKELMERIGYDAFQTITTELHRVAVHYQDDPKRGDPIRTRLLGIIGLGVKDYATTQNA